MTIAKEQVLKTLEQSIDVDELNNLRKVISTFEDFDRELWGDLVVEKPHYAQDDFNTSLNQLEGNFCHERLKQTIEIKLNLIEIGAKGFTDQSVSEEKQVQNTQPSLENNHVKVDDLSATLTEALSNQDLRSIKVSLLNLLLDNSKPFDKLQKLLLLIKGKVPEVFQAYIEDDLNEPMNKDKNHWVSDYFHVQNLSLENNFSLERYQHLLDVREHLRVSGDPNFQYIEATKPKTPISQSQANANNGSHTQNRTGNTQSSWLDELIDILVGSLEKIKDVTCDLIEKVKSKLK